MPSIFPIGTLDDRYVNITGDTMTGELEIKMADPALFISDPNIAHGITDLGISTNTIGSITSNDSTLGGANVVGISAGDGVALQFLGIIGTASPSSPPVAFTATKKDGTGVQSVGAAERAVSFYNWSGAGSTELITIFGNGDSVFIGDLRLDDGSNASPNLYLRDGDDKNLRLYKDDDGEAWIINDEAEIFISPSNDLDDYFVFSTVANIPTLGITADTDLLQLGNGTLTVAGNIIMDDGSGNSPTLSLKDGDDNTLTITKTDAGASFIDSTEGAIGIRPAGDTTNYLYFSVSLGVPFLGSVGANNLTLASASGNITAQNNLYIDDASGDSPYVYWQDGSDNYFRIKKDDDGWASLFNNEGAILIVPSNNSNDYFSFETVADVPTLSTVGNCNLKLVASSGTIDCDDDDVTTTGSITDKTDFKVRTIGITIDGGGSAITTGVKGYIEVPYACTINQVTMLADQSGDAVVDIWKDTYANYPPTDADSITAAAVPTISSATKSQDATLTGWTTAITAGDILGFNVDSAATITRLHVILKVTTDV